MKSKWPRQAEEIHKDKHPKTKWIPITSLEIGSSGVAHGKEDAQIAISGILQDHKESTLLAKGKQPKEVVLVAEERPMAASLSKEIQFQKPHNQGIGSAILSPIEIQNPNPTKMGKDLIVLTANVEGLHNSNFQLPNLDVELFPPIPITKIQG
ncbi:hypothetical protein ACH5RR_023289 [Cinchona calisaya]|uniref:Uncharacterized protein n=1 Tax=Cinchona calisaya TaxID=153742 RepID=A0ABD2ZA90_9GENT